MNGAWGLGIPDLTEVSDLLVPVPDEWPCVEVSSAVVANPSRENEWGPERARYRLTGGNHISIERRSRRVRLELSAPVPQEAVVTPHLSSAASSFAVWRGAEPFHAGAFVHGGGAWGVFGVKGAGKTSTLAALAELGVQILADDLSIYDHGDILAGPRALDLRSGPAEYFGAGKDLGVVGGRRRWRIYLPQVPSGVPLRGWLLPSWGKARPLELLALGERLSIFTEFRALRVPWENPETLLDVAAHPVLRWTRPRDASRITQSVEPLLDGLANWNSGLDPLDRVLSDTAGSMTDLRGFPEDG
jgi:hypothetical protein